MFKIIESVGVTVAVESNCATIEAANNRLRMLRRRNPGVTYWIQAPVPAVTVTPIPNDDHYITYTR